MATKRITDFNEGMSADLRSSRGCARVQHFQVHPHKLVPQFSTEASESKTLKIVRFAYAPWDTAGTYSLFGYGVVVGQTYPAIYKRLSNSDIINSSWTTADDTAAAGARDERVFFHYKNYLYGFRAGTTLWRYGNLISSPTYTATYQSVSYSALAEPVHHPADDCAYFFVDNKIYRLNNTTWDGLVLTLPDYLTITSADAHGDYLAIACKPKDGLGKSIVFLWDRDSSLATISQKVDWGRGDLIHIASLEGVLIGITDYFTSSSYGHSQGKMIVKRLEGGRAKTLDEYVTGGTSYFGLQKFVVDDKLHFTAEFARDGGMMHGIWSVDAYGRVAIELSEAETDAITNGVRYQGFYKTGEHWWIAHSNDGSVNRTDDQTAYTYTSIYETNIIGSPDEQSQLKGATLAFEPLPSGASATLKFRKVGTTSWTTIGTTSTEGATTLSKVNNGSTQSPVFNEGQFRIESTGGAIITALEYTLEANDKKQYG